MTMDDPANNEVFRPLTGDTFHFNCHKDISCFTECCAKLRLILTPYDILRMKNRVGLTSDEFLDKFTDTDMTSHHRFPMVKLKMRDDEKKTCPFVTEEGCSIYEDRPGACRIYPIGRAARMVGADGEESADDKFFFVEESHCLGFREERLWTLEEWLGHEGVSQYNTMNDKWLEIIGGDKNLGTKDAVKKKVRMFFMASYNLDRFRDFIFQSRFFDLFDVDQGLKEAMKSDDEALISFAFDWLKFSLFGDKTIQLRSQAL
ncbi:MAG: YkgJ family cysteine cluster protein [Desulfobacterales bacterium]|nr:YkgJ family cysteine cluster protein [Desulfobacterales bacterium]